MTAAAARSIEPPKVADTSCSHHRLGLANVVVGVEFRDIFFGLRKPLGQFFASRVLIEFVRRLDGKAFESGEQRQRRLVAVFAILPDRVAHDGVVFGLPEQQVERRQPRGSNDRNCLIDEVRVGNHPLKSLHAAHRNSHHRFEVIDVQ